MSKVSLHGAHHARLYARFALAAALSREATEAPLMRALLNAARAGTGRGPLASGRVAEPATTPAAA